MKNMILRASIAGVAAASPALAEKGPEVLDIFPEPTPAVAAPYENAEAPQNKGFSNSFTETTGNWALKGSDTVSANASESYEESVAKSCRDFSLRESPDLYPLVFDEDGKQSRIRIRGVDQWTFFINDWYVRDGASHPDPAAELASCPNGPEAGRSITAQPMRKIEGGSKKARRWNPYGPKTSITSHSNEGLNYYQHEVPQRGQEQYTTIKLRDTARCAPGKNKRTGKPRVARYGVKFTETSYHVSPPESQVTFIIDNAMNSRYRPC